MAARSTAAAGCALVALAALAALAAGAGAAPEVEEWRAAAGVLAERLTPGVPVSFYEEALRGLGPADASLGGPTGLLCSPATRNASADGVNVFIGTGGHGYGCAGLSPYAQVPFGTVRAGPDTAMDWLRVPWRNTGGYSYCDTHVRAFSHTHLAGAGTMGYGNVGVMPSLNVESDTVRCRNALPVNVSDYEMRACNFRAPFSHADEEASPGLYSAVLDLGAARGRVNASITAAPYAAVHRYEWSGAPAAARAAANGTGRAIIFDACHSAAMNPRHCVNASVTVDAAAGEVTGQLRSLGNFEARFGGYLLYFVARFSEPLDAARSGVWSADGLFPGRTTLRGNTTVGAVAAFGGSSGAVEMRLALSFVSPAQARANLDAQAGDGVTFEQALAAARAAWGAVQGSASVAGGTASDRVKFRTALYRSFGVPTRFTEEGGLYLGFGSRVRRADGFQYYTDLSIWDTFRTHFPMLVLLRPAVAGDIMRSMLAMDDAQGMLPKWALANGETGSMIGLHSVAMLVDGVMGGAAAGLDEADLLRRAASSVRRAEGEQYARLGYAAGAPSTTLAFSLDDHCVAALAARTGNETVRAAFNASAQNWRNNWNEKARFFCPRDAQGNWQECDSSLWGLKQLNPFDKYYTEGDAWHWRWSVQQDWPALVRAFGSPAAFVDALDQFFSLGEWDHLRALPNPWFWAGNEPDIHAAAGFLFAGRPDLTQKYTRRVLQAWFTDTTAGIPGNDDYGAMSSWVLLSSIGLYPLHCGGRWALGSPVFDKVTLQRPGGAPLTVVAHNNSPDNVYVTRVLLNGRAVDGWTVAAADLQGEATLEFYMAAAPPSRR